MCTMTYAQALAFINSFSHSGTPIHDLHRITGLMEQLGNPQERLQFIHIAGTNGKGSVAEYLGNILWRSGYRTGVFTSPYIRCYEDRIRLNGENLPQDMLCQFCEMVAEVVVGDEGYSQFEITFAIAMLYYMAVHAEVVVLETGMGGLLDCTNIIAPPLCSVITSVSLDHMAILGDTIEKIAAQKAGIIKSGSPAVMAVMSDADVVRLIMETSKQQGSPVYTPDMMQCKQLVCSIAGNQFVYRQKKYRTRMGGVHQIYNALTTLTVVDVLREQGFSVPEQAVQCGLYETQVPGRIQVLQENPLVLLDGGHNVEGVAALVKLLRESGVNTWYGICGMTHQDAVDTVAKQLAPLFRQVFCVDGFVENAISGERLKAHFDRYHTATETSVLETALSLALAQAVQTDGAVVICGSLYLVSWYLNQQED